MYGVKLNLQSLWQKLAQRHRHDPDRPGASPFQVFNRTADEFARKLVDEVNAPTSVRAATCVECGAGSLEHFYTSKKGGSTLCPSCYQNGVARRAVQESDTHHP